LDPGGLGGLRQLLLLERLDLSLLIEDQLLQLGRPIPTQASSAPSIRV